MELLIIRALIFIIIGGLIGWTTNIIAIKMLFRPVDEKKILFWKLQGVLPKRQTEIAKSIGETVEKELISKEEVLAELLSDEKKRLIKQKLAQVLTEKIKSVIPQMVLAMFGANLDQMIQGFIDEQGDQMLAELLENIQSDSDTLNIAQIIQAKIEELDFLEFEAMVYRIMKTELKHIEQVGLYLGLAIGMVQFVITLFI